MISGIVDEKNEKPNNMTLTTFILRITLPLDTARASELSHHPRCNQWTRLQNIVTASNA
jgi:hypothetical protein